jgi:SAM-dependent methyltransferase
MTERDSDMTPGVTPVSPLPPAWRNYFTRLLGPGARRFGASFLRADVAAAMQRLVPAEARVLEVGVGEGHLLAALPNRVRHGIDALPEAVAAAREHDARLRVVLGDASTFASPERYDAILCDRLCHAVPDVQVLLENLARHLAPRGRIFLTCFNFIWSVPLAAGRRVGLREPSPPENWFSEQALDNLFTLAGLEAVQYEDRVLVPARVPGAGLANRFGARLPGLRFLALYRVYTLRRREEVEVRPKVTVVVPVRNEAGNLEAAVARTPVMGAGTELVFVEGGSKDDTLARARALVDSYKGPLTLKLLVQEGKGKGDAVRKGFAGASGDILMILDGDLTVAPEDLPKFYRALASGHADYVHGTRLVYPMEDDAMRFLNRLGNIGFAKTFTFLLGQSLTDTLCGTKVLWRSDWEGIAAKRTQLGDLDPFGDFDLIFGARRRNLKILEIPIRYASRTYGETNISRFRHGLLLARMCFVAARRIKFV